MTGTGVLTAADADRPIRTGSLRRRVVLAVLSLLLVVLVLLGVTVDVLLGQRLRADLEQRLVDRASYARALAEQGLGGQDLVDRLAGQGITAGYLTGGQELYGRERPRPPAPPGPRNASTGPAAADGGATAATAATVRRSGDLLAVTVALPAGTLTLTADDGDTRHTLALLNRIELLAGLVTLVVTGLALTRVVGAALGPLDRMTTLARRIAAGTRGRRLRPTRRGTDLGRTAVAFDAMLDALEAAEAAATTAEDQMRQFLANASHDLRTPIAGLTLVAETLLRDDPDRDERERRLVGVVREGHRAGRLVEDLLLSAGLAAGESPARPVTPVDLAAAAGRVVESQRDLEPSVRWVVRSPSADPLLVSGDPDELSRAVVNLTDNARHAAGPGGSVTVGTSRSAGWVHLDVTDSGPGVAAADREVIFDRLVRLPVPSSGGGYPGSGLGLPIARAVARRHGGDLRCLPSSGGAHFRLSLPAGVPEGRRPAEATASA